MIAETVMTSSKVLWKEPQESILRSTQRSDGRFLTRSVLLVAHLPVLPSRSDEPPAPAADGSQFPEPAEPRPSEPIRGAHEYAQRADHPAAAAAEASASEDPDGERED